MIRIQYCHLIIGLTAQLVERWTGNGEIEVRFPICTVFLLVKSFDTEIRVAFTRKVLTPSWRHFRVKFNTFRVIFDAAEIRVY